jgi:hypothetical protein
MAKACVVVVLRRYVELKHCPNELVAMMKSGKPMVLMLYNVEPMDVWWMENCPFATAFEKHNSNNKIRTKKV